MEKEKLKLTGILEERFQHYDEVLENGCNDPYGLMESILI